MHSPGTPFWGCGVLILAVCPTLGGGVTAPLPQWVLEVALSHPHWQLWSSPCHQGHSHQCAQRVRMAVSPRGSLTHPPPTPPQLPSPSPIPKQVADSHEHPRDPSCAVQPPDGHPLSVPRGSGGWSQCPRSAVAEPPPGVTLSRPLSATQCSPPPALHAAADGGGDIHLQVTHLTVAVSPPPSSSLCPGWRSLEPTRQRWDGQAQAGGVLLSPPSLPQAPPTSAPLMSLHPPPQIPSPKGLGHRGGWRGTVPSPRGV